MRLKDEVIVLLIATVIVLFTAMNYSGKKHKKIICFGDSITHGAHVNGHSWVYFLSKEHEGIDFINEGRNGRKTSDKAELLPILKKYSHADYYLIFLGVNDLKNGNDSLVNKCVENMKWMIKKIKESDDNTEIVILAPSDINLKTMSKLNVKKKYNENTKESLAKLENKYKELAKEDSLGFISLLHAVSPPNYVDGLHPDVRGQEQIAAVIWKSIKVFLSNKMGKK